MSDFTVDQMAAYFRFLDRLRDSGKCNMYMARLPLIQEFSELAENRGALGAKVLSAWMATFDGEIQADDRAKQALVI